MSTVKGVVERIYLNDREVSYKGKKELKIGPVLVVDGKKISLPLRKDREIKVQDKEGEWQKLMVGHKIAIKTEEDDNGYLSGSVAEGKAKITGEDKKVMAEAKKYQKQSGNNKSKSDYNPEGAMLGGCKHDAAAIVAAMINQGSKYSKELFESVLTDMVTAQTAKQEEVKPKKTTKKAKQVEEDNDSAPFDVDDELDSDSDGLDLDDMLD